MELGYCEIYKPTHHGILNNNNDKRLIYCSILFQFPLSLDEFYNTGENSVKQQWEQNGPWKHSLTFPYADNSYIRNPYVIKLNDLQILQIIEYNDYTFCIIKTFWLKILQRRFKNKYKSKMNKVKSLKYLFNRSLIGK